MDFSMDFVHNAFDILNSMIIPVVGFVITWSEVRDARRDKRIRDFSKAGEVSPEDRSEFAAQVLEIYRKQYASEIKAGTMVVRSLIYPTEWVQPPHSDSFMLLKDVPVDISYTKWDAPPPRSPYLPYIREGYAANRKTFSNGALLFNGPLFALERFSGTVGNHNLSVTVKTAGYFDFLDTCEYLVFEASYLHKIKRKKLPQKLSRFCGLPLRANRRSCGISTTALPASASTMPPFYIMWRSPITVAT